jgi:hypothetical protein
MTTLVFQPGSGLQNVQVGAADIVSLLSVARSAWGWIGGLDGVKSILDTTRAVFGIHSTKVPVLNLQLPRANYHIVTYRGLIPRPLDDTYNAFGGDATLQFVGATLCALAHECGSDLAVQLFMKCIAPVVFDEEFSKVPALKEAVQVQIVDNIASILNDGAAHGLTQRFRRAAEEMGITHGDHVWLRDYVRYGSDVKSGGFPGEMELVGGMLKWIIGTDRSLKVYQTRSGLVARIAIYLREVGYPIDPVRAWNGEGHPPMVSRGVVLVTGGLSDTDTMRLFPEESNEYRQIRISHYRFSTVGSMLVNATTTLGDIAPETAQTIFLTVNTYIKQHLAIEWRDTAEKLHAIFTFTATQRPSASAKAPSPFALSLASIYFPLSAKSIASCYDLCHIATAKVRECVDEYEVVQFDLEGAECPPDLLLFRYVTCSIVLSTLGQLGGPDFWSLMHTTALDLHLTVWLREICEQLDKAMKPHSSLKFEDAVPLVATIHTAHEMADLSSAYPLVNIIGAKKGVFAVLPALFMNMANVSACVGLQCIDKFVGNLWVHPGGWIKEGFTREYIFRDVDESTVETHEATGFELATLRPKPNPRVGPPIPYHPDIPIYISIERGFQYSTPDLLLTGRVHGEIVGAMSFTDTMCVIARSLKVAAKCPGGCHSAATVLNVSASEWIGPHGLFLDSKRPIYLQVDDDPAWSLFAAGYAAMKGGYISTCTTCTINEIGTTMDYTGYRTLGARSVIIGGVEIGAGQNNIDVVMH